MHSPSRGLRRNPYFENHTDPARARGSGSGIGIGVDLTGFEADDGPSDMMRIIGRSLLEVTRPVWRFAWVPSAMTQTTVVPAMIPRCANWLMFRERSSNRKGHAERQSEYRSISFVNWDPVERCTRRD
jgi:hypothetical protein